MFTDINLFKKDVQDLFEELKELEFLEVEEKIKKEKEITNNFKDKARKYLPTCLNIINTNFGCQFSLYKMGKDFNSSFKVIETNVRKSREEVEFELNNYSTASVNIFRTLVGCCPAILGLYFAYNNKDLDEQQVFYIYMLIINASTRIVTSESAYLARLACYPTVFVPLGLGYLTDICSQKYYKVFRAGILILYMLFWLYEVLNTKTLREFEWIFSYL